MLPSPLSGQAKIPTMERLRAGGELLKTLKERIDQYPDSKHFIISHSHGGNVVLYALRDKEIRSNISGLLFMGVPFITCEERDIDECLGFLPRLIAAVATFICSIPLKIVLFIAATSLLAGIVNGLHIKSAKDVDSIARVVLYIPDILVILAFWLGSYKLFQVFSRLFKKLLHHWAEQHQTKTLERFVLPKLDQLNIPIFCSRARGDEAYWLLKTQRYISHLPHEFWRARSQGLLIGGLSVLFLMAILGITSIDPTLLPSLKKIETIQNILAFAVITYFVIGVFVHSVMLLLPILIRSYWWGFGGESLLDNWFTDIRPEPLPVGSRRRSLINTQAANNLVLERTYQVTGLGLRHCLIFENKDFLDDVDTLIGTRVVSKGAQA